MIGDFSKEMINDSLNSWEYLSNIRTARLPGWGAHSWIDDYRPKTVQIREEFRSVHNDIRISLRNLWKEMTWDKFLGIICRIWKRKEAIQTAIKSYLYILQLNLGYFGVKVCF